MQTPDKNQDSKLKQPTARPHPLGQFGGYIFELNT
jgi:hypothetical protein